MSDDLVTRLVVGGLAIRAKINHTSKGDEEIQSRGSVDAYRLCSEAAERIRALEAENARLREFVEAQAMEYIWGTRVILKPCPYCGGEAEIDTRPPA
jgi:hypothetical protein